MTNCVGIHCARVLARSGITRRTATQMLIDELELSHEEAERAIDMAFDSAESYSPRSSQMATG